MTGAGSGGARTRALGRETEVAPRPGMGEERGRSNSRPLRAASETPTPGASTKSVRVFARACYIYICRERARDAGRSGAAHLSCSHAIAPRFRPRLRGSSTNSATAPSRLGILESPSAEPSRLRLPVVEHALRRHGDQRKAKKVARQTGKGGSFSHARALPPGKGLRVTAQPEKLSSLLPDCS